MLWFVGLILIIGGYYFIKAEDLKHENKKLATEISDIKLQVNEIDELEKDLDELVKTNNKLNFENKHLQAENTLLREKLQSYQNYEQRENELETELHDARLKCIQAQQDNIILAQMLEESKENEQGEPIVL